jgi:hypothetical protein
MRNRRGRKDDALPGFESCNGREPPAISEIRAIEREDAEG